MIFQKARGQVSAIDALVGITLFAGLFLVYLSAASKLQPTGGPSAGEAFIRAESIAFELTESGGSPANWSSSNYAKIGLIGTQRLVLLESKMLQLANAPYAGAAESLGAGEYNLRVRLLNTTGSLYSSSGTALQFGSDPANATGVIAPVRRIATFNGTTAMLEVTLWK